MSKSISITAACGAALVTLLALPGSLSAHITLAVQEAQVGSGYKATFRVPHGCEGSATTKVSVQLPPGVIAVKPQPKPGWTIEITRGKYAETYDYYGSKMSEGVTSVTWSAGALPDEFYDEFVLNTYLTKGLSTEGKLYFPTVQTCEKGVTRWIQIPAAGKSADDYEHPAPGMKLTKPAS